MPDMIDQFTIEFAINLASGGLPLLLACATILGVLSVRNAHLSDRSREMAKRWGELNIVLAKAGTPREQEQASAEIKSVIFQNDEFIRRYKQTAWSLALVTGAFMAFILAIVTAPRPGNHLSVPGYPGLAEAAVVLGSGLLGTGLVILIREFMQGHKTLEENSKRMKFG
jgi:hypothetical protein